MNTEESNKLDHILYKVDMLNDWHDSINAYNKELMAWRRETTTIVTKLSTDNEWIKKLIFGGTGVGVGVAVIIKMIGG